MCAQPAAASRESRRTPAPSSTPVTSPGPSPASPTRSSSATAAPPTWCCSGSPRAAYPSPSASPSGWPRSRASRVPVGSLDVTMYRDDLRLKPARTLMPTDIPAGGIDGKTVVLVDDVLYSGRTIRAALDALTEVGRPRAVQLAVLVDRGHRELPIRADFVGKNLPTSLAERVRVSLEALDGVDAVAIAGSRNRGSPMKRHLLSAADLTREDAELRAAHRRRDALAGRPADQEAARPARADRGQPLLRGLHPHPHLLRGRRQAALGRRHQLLGQGLLAVARASRSRTPP